MTDKEFEIQMRLLDKNELRLERIFNEAHDRIKKNQMKSIDVTIEKAFFKADLNFLVSL